jgi:hypothetical protein
MDQYSDPYGIPPLSPPQTPSERYRDEMIVKQAQLAETDLKEIYIQQSDLLPISRAAKRMIAILSYSLFDNAKVLGRLDYQDNITLRIAVYKARIEINTAMAGVKPSDRRNQEFINLIGHMVLHYEIYLTRAVHGWEREQQGQITMKNTSDQKITQTFQQPEDEEPSGIAGLFGKLGGR